MELLLSCTNDGPVTVVDARGDIDALSAPALQERLEMHIAAGQRHLVIDLSGVGFMDSTGLGVLVGRLKAVRQLGGVLHCVVTTDRIRRIFLATGLERVLPLHETVDEAVAAVTELPS